MTLASYVDVFFLYCCTLCMLCILHLIQKHLDDSRSSVISYLDSEELLTSSTQEVLTFDLPTLTPAIHAPVCQSARQIVQLSFAPLAHDERPSLSDSIFTVTGDSDATRAPSSERLSSGSDDTPPRGRNCDQLGSSWYSNITFSLPRWVSSTTGAMMNVTVTHYLCQLAVLWLALASKWAWKRLIQPRALL